MATKISTELLIMILNNVQLIQDLHSSSLVNRIWCKVTIPKLWELPFGQECCVDDMKLKKKALCIRTYISCMDDHTRTLLTQNGFDLSSSPPQSTFDYPSFTNKLMVNNIVYFISIYSQQIIGPDHDDNNNNNNKSEITITKSRVLFREILKLIIGRCKFVNSFKIKFVGGPINYFEGFLNNSDLIGSILELPDAPKVFNKLESFTLMTRNDDMICPLYKSIASICDNILNMDLEFNAYLQVQLLTKFISVQKRLENLSIIDNCLHPHPNLTFWAIISQKETLRSLNLKQVSFLGLKVKSSPTGQFTLLKELYFEDCYGLFEPEFVFLASSFTQLSSFHYFHPSHSCVRYPHEFITKIFLTANTNLRNIRLDLYPSVTFDTFPTLLDYCTKITKLAIHNLFPDQVIEIFNNNFNELRSFSLDCIGGKIFDFTELFCQMAENVPKSLEIIEIKMLIFSADSLRKFFEGWCCKAGGGNKKIIVSIKSYEHLKVIEEYGVKLLKNMEFDLI